MNTPIKKLTKHCLILKNNKIKKSSKIFKCEICLIGADGLKNKERNFVKNSITSKSTLLNIIVFSDNINSC